LNPEQVSSRQRHGLWLFGEGCKRGGPGGGDGGRIRAWWVQSPVGMSHVPGFNFEVLEARCGHRF